MRVAELADSVTNRANHSVPSEPANGGQRRHAVKRVGQSLQHRNRKLAAVLPVRAGDVEVTHDLVDGTVAGRAQISETLLEQFEQTLALDAEPQRGHLNPRGDGDVPDGRTGPVRGDEWDLEVFRGCKPRRMGRQTSVSFVLQCDSVCVTLRETALNARAALAQASAVVLRAEVRHLALLGTHSGYELVSLLELPSVRTDCDEERHPQ